MPFDYSKLSGLINEKCGTRAAFARQMQLSENSLSSKMNGKRPWSQKDIYNACLILGIDQSEISAYFFTRKVQSA